MWQPSCSEVSLTRTDRTSAVSHFADVHLHLGQCNERPCCGERQLRALRVITFIAFRGIDGEVTELAWHFA